MCRTSTLVYVHAKIRVLGLVSIALALVLIKKLGFLTFEMNAFVPVASTFEPCWHLYTAIFSGG